MLNLWHVYHFIHTLSIVNHAQLFGSLLYVIGQNYKPELVILCIILMITLTELWLGHYLTQYNLSTCLHVNWGGKIEVIVVKSITDKRRMQNYMENAKNCGSSNSHMLLLPSYWFPKAAFVMHDAAIPSPWGLGDQLLVFWLNQPVKSANSKSFFLATSLPCHLILSHFLFPF